MTPHGEDQEMEKSEEKHGHQPPLLSSTTSSIHFKEFQNLGNKVRDGNNVTQNTHFIGKDLKGREIKHRNKLCEMLLLF